MTKIEQEEILQKQYVDCKMQMEDEIKTIETLEMKLKQLVTEQAVLEQKMAIDTGNEAYLTETIRNKACIAQLDKQLDVSRKQHAETSVKCRMLQEQLENRKNYDKQNVIKKIRDLLKSTNMKLGDIEREAGITPGYLSRIEKDSRYASDISFNFVVTAAKMLGVTVDYFLDGESEIPSGNEGYLANFFIKLIKDSKCGKIEWSEIQPEYLVASTEERKGNTEIRGMFRAEEESETSEGRQIKFMSVAVPSATLYVNASVLKALLLGEAEVLLYIVQLKSDTDSSQIGYELFFDSKLGVSPICNSLYIKNDKLNSCLKALVQAAQKAARMFLVDGTSKEIIDQYMKL